MQLKEVAVSAKCDVLLPGAPSLTVSAQSGGVLQVPTHRGCALVRCPVKARC